jgi:CDP-paratose 2-epimerase
MQITITGGAGFIGVNTAIEFAEAGYDICVIDNLSRRGAHANIEWLHEQLGRLGRRLEVHQTDVRDFKSLKAIMAEKQTDAVIHLAGQVAVTSSVVDPREDFEINALGTFNVLESVRLSGNKTKVLFASTNKVYGGMKGLEIELRESSPPKEGRERYAYKDLPNGIAETGLLDFHSPYGCSKGAADQYVRDYSRIYGIPTVVFRQSCIYGPRQFGIEDQGWMAWFTISAVSDSPVTIYGDGKQVRDVLYITDLTRAYRLAVESPAISGHIFNIGGGPKFSLSLLELIDMLEEILGKRIVHSFAKWRPGDQPVYVSDIGHAAEVLKWEPKVDPKHGVLSLVQWVQANKALVETQLNDLLR